MGDQDKSRLNTCLADYHRRASLGERVDAEQYRDELGDLFPEFERCLHEGAMIDDSRDPPDPKALPRPFGQFTLLKELGRGATGVVYEAVQRHLGRRVALKVLRTGFDTHRTARERFRREARACAQIEHDHIVEIYEAGVEEDRPYYAMTLLKGKALDDLILDNEVPEHRELCREMANVADALREMHDAGIVHRDIKPSNLMVDEDGRMILADFGLARTADAASLTQTGDALGTPMFMSPEQMLGKKKEIDGRTDIYGLGATLYQCITGCAPFETQDLAHLLRMVLTERPQSPRKLNPEVPKELERIVMKCLEKRPQDRYATAEQLRNDLLAFASGGEVKAKPVSRARHEARRMLSTPRRIAVASVVVLLIGAVAFLLTSGSGTMVSVKAKNTDVAMVVINGRSPVPQGDIEVEPGLTKVVVTADGYFPYEDRFEVKKGEKVRIAPFLAPTDFRENPESRDKFIEGLGLGIERAKIKEGSRERSGSRDDELILVFPRGKVRAQDLRHVALNNKPGFEITVPEMWEGSGTVLFAIDGEDVATTDFPDPEDLNTVIAFPDELVEALAEKQDAVVDWRFEQGGKVIATTSFELVSSDLGQAWNKLQSAKQLASPEAAGLKGELEMEILFANKLDMAVLATLDRLDSAGQANLRHFLLAKEALVDSFGGDAREAAKTERWSELSTRIDTADAFSDEEKQAAYDEE